MAEPTPKSAERFEFPWRVLFWAAFAAFGTFAVAAWLIVTFAPSLSGPAATLRDWQTFLAGVFGFTGLIVGAILNAAEMRARDDRLANVQAERDERLHRHALDRNNQIRDEERGALAAALIGEVSRLGANFCHLGEQIVHRLDDGDTKPISILRYAFQPNKAIAERLWLLGNVEVITNVSAFYGEANFFQARNDDKDALDPDKTAQVAFTASAAGILCIERLAPIAGLDEIARDSSSRLIGLHALPEERVRSFLAKSNYDDPEILAILERLRTQVPHEPSAERVTD